MQCIYWLCAWIDARVPNHLAGCHALFRLPRVFRIALLGARLTERGSGYHVVFEALSALVGEPADMADIRR